jgi:hypothetical protein
MYSAPALTHEWTQYRAWLRARIALELQAQAICRGFAHGDKTEGGKLWQAALKGSGPDYLMATLVPFLESIPQWNANLKPLHLKIEKQAKATRYYAMLPKGFGAFNLTALLGEAGDIASYRNGKCLEHVGPGPRLDASEIAQKPVETVLRK